MCFIFNKHLKIEEDFKQTFCLKVKRKSVDCVAINFFCNDVHLENIFLDSKKKFRKCKCSIESCNVHNTYTVFLYFSVRPSQQDCHSQKMVDKWQQ